MEKNERVIQHVSDTAIWVAYYRAIESERKDALFQDPYARALVGKKGEQIARNLKLGPRYTQWTVVIRTVIIDRLIEKMIGEGVDTVLNLGAGLDSRPYRMTLPQSLLWIEVDHPHVIEHKQKILAMETPRCRLERTALDLADREKRKTFFKDVNGRAKKVLVLTEGVLPYLSESQVAELGEDLHACASFQFWIGEYMAKAVYRYINTPQRRKQMENAPFRFFPDDWLGFFKKLGWVPQEIKYTSEETVKLGRKVPSPWWTFLFRWFANEELLQRVRKMTGFVLFRRA